MELLDGFDVLGEEYSLSSFSFSYISVCIDGDR